MADQGDDNSIGGGDHDDYGILPDPGNLEELQEAGADNNDENPEHHMDLQDIIGGIMNQVLNGADNRSTHSVRSSRRMRPAGVPEKFKTEATAVLDLFKEHVEKNQKNAAVTENMRLLALTIQEAFEEYLALHRDPAEELCTVHGGDAPKINFILDKLKPINENDDDNPLHVVLCKRYILDAFDDPDMQYYACIILYAVVQGYSSAHPENAEDMHTFFADDNIYFPLVHLMTVNPAENSALRVPTRNIKEIRALTCGIFGTLLERTYMTEFSMKFPAIRSVVPAHVARLRDYAAVLKPAASETQREPPVSPPVFQPPNPPSSSQPRGGSKRRLDRMRSLPESTSSTPSSSRRKKPKILHSARKLDMDETSSSSSWAEYERLQIGELAQNFRVLPMEENLEVRLTLDLLVGVASVSDLSAMFYDLDALGMCYAFLDARKKLNVRILGQVVHFLANLLQNARFATKFLEAPHRLNQLIRIPSPSIPSVFVAKAIMYMVSSSDYVLETLVKSSEVVQSLTSFMAEAGLKSGHGSARRWACRYFTIALKYRAFLDAFDDSKVDGLRTVMNVIGKYDYLWKPDADLNRQLVPDEQLQTAMDDLLTACQVVCSYFTTDMVIKAEYFRQDLLRKAREQKKEHSLESRFPRVAPNKAVHLERDDLDEVRDFMLTHVPLCQSSRDRVLRFVKLDGVQRLLEILEDRDVDHFMDRGLGTPQFHRLVLEILEKCVMSRCAQDAIIKYKTLESTPPYSGFGLLIETAEKYDAEGDLKRGRDVKKLALHVIANCVYGLRTGRQPEEQIPTGSNRKSGSKPFHNDSDHFENIVHTLRQNKCLSAMKDVVHGAMEAEDEPLRALACKVLTGMARSEPCRQIMKELSFFKNGEIIVLMKDPLTIDGSKEFRCFERYAREMLEVIFDTKIKTNQIPISLPESVLKQDILRRTRITFSSQEVDMLLLGHLQGRGLRNTAACLTEEVGLHDPSHGASKHEHKSRRSISPGVIRVGTAEPAQASGLTNGFKITDHIDEKTPYPVGMKNYILDATEAPATVNGLPNLVGIVANNFRAQHAQCEYPIAVCPPFSLKRKHQCPTLSRVLQPPENISMRSLLRPGRPEGHLWGRAADRRYLFSRYKNVSTFEYPPDAGVFDPEGGILSAAFLGPSQRDVVLGTCDGHLVFYNLSSPLKPSLYKICHEFECETNHLTMLPNIPACDIFLSSCSSGFSTLFKYDTNQKACSVLKQFPDIEYMDFPHEHTKIAIGAVIEKPTSAFIVDLETGDKTLTFSASTLRGTYTRNRPSFHPSDDLITTEGFLFDARSGTMVHQFDQFEWRTSNGIFHPNGNVIIIDEQVWDLRTFKLLRSVPTFHQSLLKFNHTGDVLYAFHFEKDAEEGGDPALWDFHGVMSTVDARDYTQIAGVELKRKYQCVALDTLDRHVVFGEPFNENFSTYARLYEIGRVPDEEDDEDKEDEGEDGYLDADDDEDDDDDMTAMFENDENYEDDLMDWDEEDDNEEDSEHESEENEWTTDESEAEEEEEEDDDDYVYELGN